MYIFCKYFCYINAFLFIYCFFDVLLCLILLPMTDVYNYHCNWFSVTFFNDQSKKAILEVY